MTLHRKVEAAFAAFIKSRTATVLELYTVYEASKLAERRLPIIGVQASGEKEVFAAGSPRYVELTIVIGTSIDDNERGKVPDNETRATQRAQHDDALTAMETALEAPGAIAVLQAFMNAGGSKRPVSDFHLYDITKTDEQTMETTPEERQFSDGMTFEVICQNCDG